MEGGGGALVVAEAVAEGLQEAFGHEEERLMGGHGRLEVVLALVVLGCAVELEETMVLAVGDVVEGGQFTAKAFRQSLARELRKVTQGL